ncbi:MAG: AHH domain-containing protein [Deltaproteobacteria bacterium]|nr:AHH domain-containing protein [Deltaproteobacteria bacterium]
MAKSADEKRHSYDSKILKKHVVTKSVSGGSCLNRHEWEVKEKCSCSHRWQAYKKAEDDKMLYNYPAYASLVSKSVRHRRAFKSVTSSGVETWRNRPNPYDWDLGKNDNFLSKCTTPYYHNSHHLLPTGLLNGCILKAAQEAKSYTLYKLIRIGLLDAKYNINHKNNMVILPKGKFVANHLRLPRHTSEIDVEPGVRPDLFHSVYSDRLRNKVQAVIDEYLELLDEPDENHGKPPNKLSKAKLERISKKLYKKVKKWGKGGGGPSVDSMSEWLSEWFF